jgi:hypothetical protein
MALDKPGLVTALTAAFAKGLNDPAWTQADAAQALADAIDAFVRGGVVSGMTMTVKDINNINDIGHGAQDAPVGLT